ncbi:MAG TPA: SLC13 family permease [Gammaproteobacteria bacterium]
MLGESYSVPNLHALAALLLTVVALYLFTRDKIPLEASALAILVTLLLVFQLSPYEDADGPLEPTRFLSGFGHEALITIAALMIIAKGLETTGALQPLALRLARAWTARPRGAILMTMLIAAVLSAFVNHTPVLVMLLPMLIGVAVRNKIPPSSILMPIGFAALLGGMATTIGTSTNLLVVGIAADSGLPELGMFDFTLPAVLVGSIGMAYLWLIAPRLLPARKPPLADTSPRVFNATLHITEDSAARGRTFAECLAMTNNEMRVDRIERGEGLVVTKLPIVRIQAGDRFVVRDTPERLKEFEKQLGATLHDVPATAGVAQAAPVEQEQLAEIVVTRGSMLHRASLAATRFAQRTGLLPLALHRARADGEPLSSHIGLVPLRAGDVVLVQGTTSDLERLKRSGTALVLDGTTDLPRTHRADRALTIMVLVVVAAAAGIVPIAVSAVVGVGLMLATRCLAWRDIGSALSAPMIMVIVTSLALAQAMTETGAVELVARPFVAVAGVLPVGAILSGLMLIVTILTNVVSNNAAGVIAAPIAIQVARDLGVSPEPFVLAVLFGANMSYATPFGYQTNLLLLTAGGYKFADFVRAGVPLTVILWLGFSFALPAIYGL